VRAGLNFARVVAGPVLFGRTLHKGRGLFVAKGKRRRRRMKCWSHRGTERTVDTLWSAIGRSLGLFTPDECANYFSACGYDPDLDPADDVDLAIESLGKSFEPIERRAVVI
jgi:hypothetical protein